MSLIAESLEIIQDITTPRSMDVTLEGASFVALQQICVLAHVCSAC
jgi:hypothetical protein